jgi:hypothetical protein
VRTDSHPLQLDGITDIEGKSPSPSITTVVYLAGAAGAADIHMVTVLLAGL